MASEVDEIQRHEQLAPLCVQLFQAISNPTEHLVQLNKRLSSLLPNLMLGGSSCMDGENLEKTVFQRASHILRRLPPTPMKLLAFRIAGRNPQAQTDTIAQRMRRAQWSPEWLIDDARHKLSSNSQMSNSEALSESELEMLKYTTQDIWGDLIVTNHIDDNSVALLVMLASQKTQLSPEFSYATYKYVDTLAQLLNEFEIFTDYIAFCHTTGELPHSTIYFPEGDVPINDPQRLNVVRTFLWGAWQRSTMLHLYGIVGAQLHHGSSADWNDLVAVRGVGRLEELSDSRLMDIDYRGASTSQYLCNWALELLRRSRTAIGLDFRCLLERFTSHFGDRPGRCSKSSSKSCLGDDPSSCQRFTGAETLAQSAHIPSCDSTCGRIFWNEASYLKVESPRAVRVDSSKKDLQYCVASEQTLAISHVWAHGQGGRPEDGINRCLHARYSDLATKHECDSYWIDSTCIPTDDRLRKEAIAKINTIFATSKAVLVSDQDVQSVDLANGDIGSLETVLSVLLVCDWNVRAWTMLEATRGNQAVHILCKGDETISLVDLTRRVWEDGSISLATLIGSAGHLIPTLDETQRKTAEEAGYILSQRHASRPGDDVIIWGLLNNSKNLGDVLNLWKDQRTVKTAYLMSSAPRIQNARGFGWAPSTPTILPQARHIRCDEIEQAYTARYHSYDGYGSYEGRITDSGLLSVWMYTEFDASLLEEYRERLCERYPAEWDIKFGQAPDTGQDIPEDAEVYGFPDAALAFETIAEILGDARVRVLKPAADDGRSLYIGGDDRGDYTGAVAAITASKDQGRSWHWLGVFKWVDENISFFEGGEMLIV
ncbi:hypothetical protein NA57DRAFT_76399 [Rhizodiscina lignyota]|uniref:Heterokaryon incompatibility domain-containing protein n=1 Tax=Rhizodiscina lignyota TaxID=1504668 RepID=A0A9P4IIN7_9PEZI|nr:hypothetical protein NA57DRAFT_76399 [Rhizodiscina lignyota]